MYKNIFYKKISNIYNGVWNLVVADEIDSKLFQQPPTKAMKKAAGNVYKVSFSSTRQ